MKRPKDPQKPPVFPSPGKGPISQSPKGGPFGWSLKTNAAPKAWRLGASGDPGDLDLKVTERSPRPSELGGSPAFGTGGERTTGQRREVEKVQERIDFCGGWKGLKGVLCFFWVVLLVLMVFGEVYL